MPPPIPNGATVLDPEEEVELKRLWLLIKEAAKIYPDDYQNILKKDIDENPLVIRQTQIFMAYKREEQATNYWSMLLVRIYYLIN